MADKIVETCDHVADGDTLSTEKNVWLRLARYDAPDKEKTDHTEAYVEAFRLLSSLVLNKVIEYQQVGTTDRRIIAEVWQNGKNISDAMLQSGHKK